MTARPTPIPAPRGNPERLATDRDLYEQLQADRFTGLGFEQLREDLWVYGWRVMRSWMRDGTVIERCRERRIFFAAPYTEVEEMMRRTDVRDEIAHECVAHAVTTFMAALPHPQSWDPDRGATMRTYFIGRCLMSFRDAYQRWAGTNRKLLGIAIDGYWRNTGDIPDRPAHALTPAEMIVLRDTLDQILDGASMEERAICRLILFYGATQEEIAEQLGITRKAVERRLARVRGRARALAAAGQIIVPSVRKAVPA
nr:sigma-70 family RNA polymerase sigma factor [Streptomyces sp. NBC_00974]